MSGWRIVTVSGLPGSGTSTACGLLADESGWRYTNVGGIFREMAREQGVSLSELGALAEEDGEIDRQLDARVIAMAQACATGVILEGRLTGWMAWRHELPALKVWLDAAVETRAERVGYRDRQAPAQAAAAMAARESSEASRYADHHGIDITDLSIYDLVIDSVVHSAEQIAQRIAAALDTHRPRARGGGEG